MSIKSFSIAELRAQRAMLAIEARKYTAKGNNMTSTDREAIDRIVADSDALNEAINEAENRAAARPPRGQVNQPEKQSASTRSFEKFIRTGEVDAELRGLGTGTVTGSITGGNVLVPSEVADLTIVQQSFGTLAGSVQQFVTDTGVSYRLPIVDDSANDLTELAPELTDSSEVDPVFASVNSTVAELTSGVVVVSNQLLQDSAYSVSDMINEIFNTRVINGLSKRIYNGTATSFAAITAGVPVKVTTASPTAIAWNELTSLYGSLNAALRPKASFVLSSLSHAYLMGLTNSSTGQPILQPDVHGNPFMSLLGRPLVIAEQAATAGVANASNVLLFGDLSSYRLRTVRNASIVRLNEKYATQAATGFILFTRAGGVSVSQSSVPSLVSLKMHA